MKRKKRKNRDLEIIDIDSMDPQAPLIIEEDAEADTLSDEEGSGFDEVLPAPAAEENDILREERDTALTEENTAAEEIPENTGGLENADTTDNTDNTSENREPLPETETSPEPGSTESEESQKLPFLKRIFQKRTKQEYPSRSGNRMIPVYFLLYFCALFYWEFLLRVDVTGSLNRTNGTLIFFIPAQALFLTALSGFQYKHLRFLNGITATLLMGLLAFYYFGQLIYHRLTGSLISVSLMGMGGEALGNFGWTLADTLKRSVLHLFLILLPVILTAVLSFVRLPSEKEGTAAPLPGGGYRLWLHALCLCASIGLWTMGSFGLSMIGRDRGSAYYIYKNTFSDTDTTSNRVGTLTTTLVEASAYYFGDEETTAENNISTVNLAALDLDKEDKLTVSANKSTSGNAVSENPAVSENVIPLRTDIPAHTWTNEAFDFEALGEVAADNATKTLCEYFASKEPTATNDYTGLFEGYNLIYVCCEAFSNYGIDPDITPTLYKMANNGIVLDNFYNSFPNTTTNGEFAFDTSLWPDVSRFAQSGTAVGSFPQSANVFMPYGLGDLFTGEGVPCYAYHNYYGDYYKRCYSWPNLGYTGENTKFMGKGMQFSCSWPASDLEMFEQSVDDYLEEDQFHAYYMTFSGHGPYNASNRMFQKNIDKVRELADGKYELDECLGYFCGEYELELAMEYLLERLEEADQLDNTVIVLIGDHFPYYLSDAAAKELNGGELDPLERNHSTCILYNAGLKEPIHCDSYCCNVDILPTILNLFNINYDSRLLMGIDVFSDGPHRARLYNGSFLTNVINYDKTSGEKFWKSGADGHTDEELDAYFTAMENYTESEYSAALNMMKSNFYLFAWKNSGLLSEEEVSAEVAREQNGQATYANEAEAARAKAEAEAAAAAAQAQAEAEAAAAAAAGQPLPAEQPQP